MRSVARNAVLGVATRLMGGQNPRPIRHFLFGGRLRRANTRKKLLAEFVKRSRRDCVVMLACGKYRFYDKDRHYRRHFPAAGCGAGHDAYSAVQIASARPTRLMSRRTSYRLSWIISWYEQEGRCGCSCAVHLGIKGIPPGRPCRLL